MQQVTTPFLFPFQPQHSQKAQALPPRTSIFPAIIDGFSFVSQKITNCKNSFSTSNSGSPGTCLHIDARTTDHREREKERSRNPPRFWFNRTSLAPFLRLFFKFTPGLTNHNFAGYSGQAQASDFTYPHLLNLWQPSYHSPLLFEA